MNNTVNKIILDRGSCKTLHKKLRFANPVFIIVGINIKFYYVESSSGFLPGEKYPVKSHPETSDPALF